MNQNVVYRQATPLRYLGACQGIPETFIRFRVFQQCTLIFKSRYLSGCAVCCTYAFPLQKARKLIASCISDPHAFST